MTGLALAGESTILAITSLWRVATKDSHICTGDQQYASFSHTLYCTIKEGVWGTIRVQVNGVEACLRLSVLVHHHARGGKDSSSSY